MTSINNLLDSIAQTNKALKTEEHAIKKLENEIHAMFSPVRRLERQMSETEKQLGRTFINSPNIHPNNLRPYVERYHNLKAERDAVYDSIIKTKEYDDKYHLLHEIRSCFYSHSVNKKKLIAELNKILEPTVTEEDVEICLVNAGNHNLDIMESE